MYYYLHVNDTVQKKPDIVVDSAGKWSYFNSPFVRTWWYVENKDVPDFEEWLKSAKIDELENMKGTWKNEAREPTRVD